MSASWGSFWATSSALMAAPHCSIESKRSARHRSINSAGIANPRGLAAGWESLSLDETVAFVRSFMLFSMLANLAEDRQGVAAEKDSTLESALAFLEAQGVTLEQAAALLEHGLITPVLTAHPTEVMRKSMLDHRNAIAALMAQRDAGLRETAAGEVIEEAIAAQIAFLWQTRVLRRERLYVADEVDTGAHLSNETDIFAGHTCVVCPVGALVGKATAKLSAARLMDRRRSRRKSPRDRGIVAPGLGPRQPMRCSANTWNSSTPSALNCRCRASSRRPNRSRHWRRPGEI